MAGSPSTQQYATADRPSAAGASPSKPFWSSSAPAKAKDAILEQYPSLEREDIRACLRFAVQLMERRYELAQVA